jgi:hypothetical protein
MKTLQQDNLAIADTRKTISPAKVAELPRYYLFVQKDIYPLEQEAFRPFYLGPIEDVLRRELVNSAVKPVDQPRILELDIKEGDDGNVLPDEVLTRLRWDDTRRIIQDVLGSMSASETLPLPPEYGWKIKISVTLPALIRSLSDPRGYTAFLAFSSTDSDSQSSTRAINVPDHDQTLTQSTPPVLTSTSESLQATSMQRTDAYAAVPVTHVPVELGTAEFPLHRIDELKTPVILECQDVPLPGRAYERLAPDGQLTTIPQEAPGVDDGRFLTWTVTTEDPAIANGRVITFLDPSEDLGKLDVFAHGETLLALVRKRQEPTQRDVQQCVDRLRATDFRQFSIPQKEQLVDTINELVKGLQMVYSVAKTEGSWMPITRVSCRKTNERDNRGSMQARSGGTTIYSGLGFPDILVLLQHEAKRLLDHIHSSSHSENG